MPIVIEIGLSQYVNNMLLLSIKPHFNLFDLLGQGYPLIPPEIKDQIQLKVKTFAIASLQSIYKTMLFV